MGEDERGDEMLGRWSHEAMGFGAKDSILDDESRRLLFRCIYISAAILTSLVGWELVRY